MRERPTLSKPRQACIHQSWVECQATLRSQPQLLHHSRSVWFQQDISSGTEILDYLHACLLLQVNCNGALVSVTEKET